MKVARWGNSLAVRIPAEMAATMALKEGDNVEVILKHADGWEDSLDKLDEMQRAIRHNEAMLRIKASQWVLPPDWKTDRDDLNERS